MRPYNVHPKVKIEDLQVLIAKRAAQADTIPPAVEAAPPEPLPAAPDPVVAVVAEPEVEAPPAVVPLVVQAVEQPVLEPPATVQPEPAPPEPAEKRSPVVATPVAGSPAPVPTEQPDVYLPDGITERQYREGNAFTIERIVTENGHSTVYKRVAHPFATFYFQDGQAIDERVWNARFQGQ